MGKYAFVQATNYHGGRLRPMRFIGMHDMEAAEGPQTAENVAGFFHRQAPSPKTGSSAHVCVDRDSAIQCVKAGDTAWAIPNANADGFHIEQPGFAGMTRAQWLADDVMLNISSCVAAQAISLLRFLGRPFEARFLTVSEIANPNGPCGLITHADATAAFHTAGGHSDPGGGFPKDVFAGKVNWWLAGHIGSIDFV